ncbi:Ferrochelatase [Candidatus Rubidus massiliensis]|nr:Ferrochelatase [Candidatus Rubidus massiliensis]
MKRSKIGVLLINLGTPDSPSNRDVYKYLIEFLTDKRVITSSWILRQILVRGFIVPRRYKQSAASYRAIWTKNGSPLLTHGQNLTKALQDYLGENFVIELAMRYQNPSIKKALKNILEYDLEKLIIFPLFPQYASATTGSVHEKVMDYFKNEQVIPNITFVEQYAAHPALIDSFIAVSKEKLQNHYDHILFSFHGLPKSHLTSLDKKNHCFKKTNCCQTLCTDNAKCYSAQCYSTAFAIANQLNLSKDDYSISFQSRLGKEPWLEPYTTNTIKDLVSIGKKKIAVFCPSFICDCLETTFEIGVEYQEEFKKLGGEVLDLIPGLNDHPVWVSGLANIIKEYAGQCEVALNPTYSSACQRDVDHILA